MTSATLRGKIAMVTGANGDMGRVIATELARQGASVVVVVRRAEQGQQLRREIALATGNLETEMLVADLADQAQIRRLAGEFQRQHAHLHLLINNAGLHLQRRETSPNGLEMHLAVNALAPFLLTHLLLSPLKAAAPARIVNVASQAMADTRAMPWLGRPHPAKLDLGNLQSERHFEPVDAYARAKLALVMLGYALSRRLEGSGVTVNALHPGIVATATVDDIAPPFAHPVLKLIKRFLLTPQEGAQAALFLSSAPEVEGVTGQYFVKKVAVRSPENSYDVGLQEQLWQASLALVDLRE